MNIYQNAALTARGRALMVQRVVRHGWSYRAVARAFGVDPKTVRPWVARFQVHGVEALQDRSSRPRRQPRRTPRQLQRQIIALRRQRWTMERIAHDGAGPRRSRAGVARRRRL